MKTLKKRSKTHQKSAEHTSVLHEFENTDLGNTLQTFKNEGRWVAPRQKTKPTSIALTKETIQTLREKASRKGIGYQTLLKMIVQEHLHEY